MCGAFVFSKRIDGLDDFILIDLRGEIDMDHDAAVLEACTGLLVDHSDNTGGIRPDLIASYI